MSEKFCLKWNDFESNFSSAIKTIREESEFCDITLASDTEQVSAHKVILSASSPFFKTVLKRNNHQHPLIYLRGVAYPDLEAVINFIYHGEVSVAQEDLNSFLQLAEDLQIKGLHQDQARPGDGDGLGSAGQTKIKPKPKQPQLERVSQSTSSSSSALRSGDDDLQVLPPQIKFESDRVNEGEMEGYDVTEDSYQDYQQEYSEDNYHHTEAIPSTHDSCPYCSKIIHRGTMKRHIKNQHEEQNSYQCQYCEGVYKNESSLKDHCRRKHNVYQTADNY